MAIAQTIVVAVVTSRRPKRSATQIMNGKAKKGSGSPSPAGVAPLKMNIVASASDIAKAAASNAFDSGHRRRSPSAHEMTSGATMSIPEVSPCHHVQALRAKSDHGIAPVNPSDTTPTAAAINAPNALRTATSGEPSTVRLVSAAPSQIPGQTRTPRSSSAASAMPEGGHTAVAYPGGIASKRDSLA